jgi:hypothetical protein
VFAIAVLGIVNLVGVLTQIRVVNVGMEDLMYVLAMNRLRAAYLELDPGIAPYLMAAGNDDLSGMSRTYYFLDPGRNRHQFLGSTMLFIAVVNSALVGLLAAAILTAVGSSRVLAAGVALLVGLGYLVLSFLHGWVEFKRFWRSYEPLAPTPPEPHAPQGSRI